MSFSRPAAHAVLRSSALAPFQVRSFRFYARLLVFVHMPDAAHGRAVLLLAGLAQNLSLVPMSVLLLYGADAHFRGRVMGLRMMAIHGLSLGLMLARALIDRLRFAPAISLLGRSGRC